MTAETHTRPASFIIFSASAASSRLHWPVLLQIMIRKDWASFATWMAANLRLIRRSLDPLISLISPVTGFRTYTGLPAPNAAARGWNSPSPMYTKQSTSSETLSAEVQLHPRTCPGYMMRLSPIPTATVLPADSMISFIRGMRSMYWIVARSPILSGRSLMASSTASASNPTSERASMYRTLGSSPMEGMAECP